MGFDCYSAQPLLFHSLWNLFADVHWKAGSFSPSILPVLTFWPRPMCVGECVYVKDVMLIVCTVFTVYSFLTNFFMIGEKCHYHCISKHITCCLKWLRSQRQFCWRYFLPSLLYVFVSLSLFFSSLPLSLCSDRCQLYSLCVGACLAATDPVSQL